MKPKHIFVSWFALLIVWSCNDHLNPQTNPEAVTITSIPDLKPEGITYDPNRKKFIVTSTTTNKTFVVSDDGSVVTLSTDPNMSGGGGVKADTKQNRLYVAGFGLGGFGNGHYGIYDLTTGAVIKSIDIDQVAGDGKEHFPNDVCFDKNGNQYVTDSFAPIIYKITPDGTATVFLTDAVFTSNPATTFFFPVGLNGIEYVENGDFLLVNNSDFGTIYKIPLGNPASFSKTPVITIKSTALDGMILLPNGKLAVVSNEHEPADVVIVTSKDNFTTATLEKTIPLTPGDATTLTVRGNDLYVVYSKLFSFPSPQTSFTLGKVRYE